MNLRCYCCGAEITERMVLIAYAGGEPVDRVFIFRPECEPKVEPEATRLQVVKTAHQPEPR